MLDKKDTNALIAVSNDLLNKAQWPRLSINEQRLILYILALVEKKDEDFKRYRISVQELRNAIGTKTKNAYDRFNEATDALMAKSSDGLTRSYEDFDQSNVVFAMRDYLPEEDLSNLNSIRN